MKRFRGKQSAQSAEETCKPISDIVVLRNTWWCCGFVSLSLLLFRFDKDQIGYAKAALSNMMGGIGFFYGQSIVASEYTNKGPLEYWAAPLYTGASTAAPP